MYCHAGCANRPILRALSLPTSLLKGSAPGRKEADPEPAAALPSRADLKGWAAALAANNQRLAYLVDERLISEESVELYEIGWDANASAYTIPYRDSGGELVNVKWYKPATSSSGKKTWVIKGRGLGDLWPVDELADADTVVLTEGEWDALVLLSEGVSAVSVPGGAGEGKWRPEWAKHFTGRRVAIATDCDKPGRALAREAAESLADEARLVWLVDLDPERTDGYDVTDFFQEGGTVEEFAELVREARTQVPHRLHVVSAWDRLDRIETEPPPRWMFSPFFMKGTYGVLGAPHKAGKTWDSAAMAVAAASGERLWGLVEVDRATDVMMFVGEDDEWLTLQRLQAICAWHGIDERDVLSRIHIAESVPHFGSERDLGVVRRQFDHHPGVRFTIVDPLYLAATGADSRQLFDMAEYLGAIQQVVVNEARSGLLIVHHWNEAGRGTGAERFAGAGAAEWGRVLISGKPDQMKVLPGGWTKRSMTYEMTGSRIPNLKLELTRKIRQRNPANPTSPYEYEAIARWAEGMRPVLSPRDADVLEVLAHGRNAAMSPTVVRKAVTSELGRDIDISTVRKALRALKTAGLADREETDRGRSLWWRI
jgi:hypothetical protein